MKIVAFIALMIAMVNSTNLTLVDKARHIGPDLYAFDMSIDQDVHVRRSVKTVWIADLDKMLSLYDQNTRAMSLVFLSNSKMVKVEFVKCGTMIHTIEDDEAELKHDIIMSLIESKHIKCTQFVGNEKLAIRVSQKEDVTDFEIIFKFKLFFVENDYVPSYAPFVGEKTDLVIIPKSMLKLAIESEWTRVIKVQVKCNESMDITLYVCDHAMMNHYNVHSSLDILITPLVYEDMTKIMPNHCLNESDPNVTISVRARFVDEVISGSVAEYMTRWENHSEHTDRASNDMIFLYLAVAIVFIILVATAVVAYRRRHFYEYDVTMNELKHRHRPAAFVGIDAYYY